MQNLKQNIDYRLLGARSELVLCSRCFRHGTATPVPQLISKRHRIRNLCSRCTEETLPPIDADSAERQRLISRYLKR